MKKVFSIVAIVIFFAAITVPVSSSSELIPGTIQVNDEKPKKKANKSDVKKEASKDCATPCGEKKAAACGEKKTAACGEKKAHACGEKEKK